MVKTVKNLEVQERYIYHPELENCLHCGWALQARRYYQWRKTVQQMDKVIYVASQARECVNPECEHKGQAYESAVGQMVTVPKCTYGLDVIVQVGWWRDKEHLNREQIHSHLRKHGTRTAPIQMLSLPGTTQVSPCRRPNSTKWKAHWNSCQATLRTQRPIFR